MGTYYRRVIRICAENSPNVRLAREEQKAGLTPSGRQIIPGILPWHDYLKRRATWDKVRQAIGLDGVFWEGADALMFPPDWLNRAEAFAKQLYTHKKVRIAQGMGIDPAEGGDKSTWAIVDEYGVIELVSKQTPDTNVIVGDTTALIRKYDIPPECVVFDRGGGKAHADRLRASGINVRTVAFGESVTPDAKRGKTQLKDRVDQKEERYEYFNRRAQLYGELRELLDPSHEGHPFGIPSEMTELRRQLSPIPLTHDPEGRLKLLPKRKRAANSNEKTLEEIIGCSPDEADATVLAVHGMLHRPHKVKVGAVR